MGYSEGQNGKEGMTAWAGSEEGGTDETETVVQCAISARGGWIGPSLAEAV